MTPSPEKSPLMTDPSTRTTFASDERTLTWAELVAALGPAAAERAVTEPAVTEPATAQPAPAPPAASPRVHVIAVDGYSGSGKTWFADRLARALDCTIYHVDEFVPGWDALEDGIAHVADHLLTPWAQGRAARVRRYDWHAARPGDWLDAAADPVVVLEGSGIGTVDPALISALVWVNTPDDLREDRLAGREDHLLYTPYRQMWAAQEQALVARADTPGRADVVVHEASETRLRIASCRPYERT